MEATVQNKDSSKYFFLKSSTVPLKLKSFLFAKSKYAKQGMLWTNASITEINLIVQWLKFFEGLGAFLSIVHL